ncbi:MAG: PorV/PorQ family protein [Bacteroidia bacterium]|nr:PorV/PorQ family protein [Bacteroidia bacterium]
MKKKNHCLIVIFLLLLSFAEVNAQVYKYSNEFLSLGIGARAYGMGNSVVSSVDDVNSVFWNPAGLTEINDNIQLAFMHNEQFAGIAKHDFGAVSYRLDTNGVIGLSLIRYGIDDIPNTLNLFQNGVADYSRVVSFSAVDYAIVGSYARKINLWDGIAVGGNVKIIRRVVGDFANAWGFGFDIGAKYVYKKWNLGAVIKDATSTFNAWQYTLSESDKQIFTVTNNQLPSNNLELTLPKLIVGTSRRFNVYKEYFYVRPEINADFTFDGKRNALLGSAFTSFDPRIGVEVDYKNFVFLRGGIHQFQQIKRLSGENDYTMVNTIGIGLKLSNLVVDYALADPGSTSSSLPYSNIISLRVNVNRKD